MILSYPVVEFCAELFPVVVGKARQAVRLLDKERIARFAVGEEAEQIGARQLGPALVLDVGADDVEAALGGEGLDLLTRAGRVLFDGGSSEIGSGENRKCPMLSIYRAKRCSLSIATTSAENASRQNIKALRSSNPQNEFVTQ